VKAVILAAGYGTRLRPLTDDRPKQLLPLGGRPMLDWILDKVQALAGIDEVHLVTNNRFARDFEEWAAPHGVVVHDDGTSSNDDRLGAVGDLELVIERAGLADEELLVQGDDLFGFELPGYVGWWRAKPHPASAAPLYDLGDLELATHYGIANVDEEDRVVHVVEKPSDPSSTLAATLTYLLPAEHTQLVTRYLAEGQNPDNAGSFLAWLAAHERVYGYRFEGRWYDIGNHAQLLDADNWLRGTVGLPERESYSLD
jgi:glucose-1-phosphate thymidylyltransferase